MADKATIKDFAIKMNISRQYLSNIINNNIDIKKHVNQNPSNKRQHLIDSKGQSLITNYLKNRVRRKYSKSPIPNIKNGLMLKKGINEILKSNEYAKNANINQLIKIKNQINNLSNSIKFQSKYDNEKSKNKRIKYLLGQMTTSQRLKFVLNPSKFINKLFNI